MEPQTKGLQNPNEIAHIFFFPQREGWYSQSPSILKGWEKTFDVGEEHGNESREELGKPATWTRLPWFTQQYP